MVLLDGDRRFLAVNRLAGDLVKLPDSDLVGRPLDEIVAKRERKAIQVGWQHLNLAGSHAGEMELVRSDRTSTTVIAMARVAEVSEGRVALCIADPVSTDERARRVSARDAQRFSPRELEIVRLVADGLTGALIAEDLFISPLTVQTHLRNAMGKVGAHTRAHLVAIALRRGLI
jgi:DNA-binding CsgD family transcriptional regulator